MSDFDVKDVGLNELNKEIEDLITHFPKKSIVLLKKVGNKGRTIVARKGRQLVGTDDSTDKKSYHKKWKRGKVWEDSGEEFKVRIYNNSPHAHLLEDGWIITGKDGSEHGFKEGLKVLEKGVREFENEYDQILEKEFDKILEKL